MFELEGVINSLECCFSLLNRSIPIFLKEEMMLKPREQKLVKIEAPFLDEISGLAIVKLLDKLTQSIIMLKVKFMQNAAMLDITNSSSETLYFKPKGSIRNIRPKIFRSLQNMTGSATTKFKQIL